MIQIYIDNKLIDLDNTNISLQKEFATEVENIPTDVEYSYTISIPASLNNKRVFGFVDTFDVGQKFSRIHNADLYVDEVLILKGKFKMTSIEDGVFKGNIYTPKKQTISDILGDKQLNEIKPHYKPMTGLGDFDKTNNTVCGLETSAERTLIGWSANTYYNEIKDNHVIYPYVLYGLPMNIAEENPDLDIFTQNLEYKKHCISENNIFPAFNVTSVLKDMFATEGYNLVGNIFNTENASYFKRLYQTFQFSYDDYKNKKEIPYYCHFKGNYTDFKIYKNPSGNSWEISRTLEVCDLAGYDQDSFEVGDKYTRDTPSRLKYGVDNPMQCGGGNNALEVVKDEKHMLTRSTNDDNIAYLIIPRSGWYKIKCAGDMKYPHKGHTYWTQDDRQPVGGTKDEADNTDLSEMPFEFQIKKGSPKDNPKLYSYNSLMPCVPTDFFEGQTFIYDCYDTYLKYGDSDSQRRYGKNGKTTYINDYSNFPTNDFVCGVRLGDAWFNGRDEWNKAHRGVIRRPNRFLQFGAGLTLPDVTKSPQFKDFTDEELDCQYKGDKTVYGREGKYFKLSDKNNTLSYGSRTAQVMVKHDASPTKSSFSNFEGYNQLSTTGWNTTSDYGKVTYDGAENSSAKTTDNYSGEWAINTVVWLEQGDILYTEVLIPLHENASYEDPGTCTSSEWYGRVNDDGWVNTCNINYDIEIGFLNGNSEWKPRPENGISTWENIGEHKLTNVNQFLPTVKCNDYLEKFLKTFNLQLTMVNDNTFSIDSNVNLNLMTNVIDIDKMVNVDDAEFKPLSSESSKQLCWKNDLSESGYKQGNNSPYYPQALLPTEPWEGSGYTGNYTITNETNTSGSVKKTESQWSYNWYKTIKFINCRDGIAPTANERWTWDSTTHTWYCEEDIPVISDEDRWREGSSYYAFEGEAPQTSKTMRLFFLGGYGGEKPYYIPFVYDQEDMGTSTSVVYPKGFYMRDVLCNLIVPEKACYTTAYEGTQTEVISNLLTYTLQNVKLNKTITEKFFNLNITGGYQIDVPIRLSNQQYASINAGTMFKLNNGLYKIKSIEGHDVNREDNATLSLLTIK